MLKDREGGDLENQMKKILEEEDNEAMKTAEEKVKELESLNHKRLS